MPANWILDRFGYLDFMPIGGCVMDARWTVLFWNNCLEEWTGISRKDIIDTDIRTHFPHIGTPKYASRIETMFSGGPPAVFSSQLHKHIFPSPLANGQFRVQHSTAISIKRPDNDSYFILFAVQDVTDLTHRVSEYRLMRDQAIEEAAKRKRTEEYLEKVNEDLKNEINERRRYMDELHKSEEKYRAIVESQVEAVCRWQPDTTITYSNHIFLNTFAPDAEEVTDMPLLSLLPENARETLRAQISEFLSAPRIFTSEFSIDDPDGNQRWYEKTDNPILSNSGDLTEVQSIIRDITERKKLESTIRDALLAADKANKAKSEFLANMSHEIRTPLNGVLGVSELLLSTPLNDRQKKYVDTIRRSGSILLALINDILDLSKIEEGKIELEKTSFHLHELIEAVGETFSFEAHNKGLELIINIDHRVPPHVIGDPSRLRQLIMNFTANALKFTDRGEIRIDCYPTDADNPDQSITMSITDTGIGIPRDRFDRLFNPFSQVDASTTRKYGGTGLGLAICQRLITMMEGKFGLDSEVGKGSTFWFQIPLPPDNTVKPQTTIDYTMFRGANVLIVDGNDSYRNMLATRLQHLGMKTNSVTDGFTALNIMNQSTEAKAPVDILILDSQAPKIDGVKMARILNSISNFSNTGIILLSHTTDFESIRNEPDLQVAAVLTKPVPMKVLDEQITLLLKHECTYPPVSEIVKQSAPEAYLDPDIGKGLILLAEDNEINQMVTSEILREKGYLCIIVENGLDAVEIAKFGKYDLILMDCQMPLMDGYEATRAIRALEAERNDGSRVPIVALTAHALVEEREKGLSCGMDDYLTKPISSRNLEKVLIKYIPENLRAVPLKPQKELPQPINHKSLLQLYDNNAATANKFIARVRERLPELVSSLQKSIPANDFSTARLFAHKISGTAAIIAAEPLREQAVNIENAARSGDIELVDKFFVAFVREYERFLEYTLLFDVESFV